MQFLKSYLNNLAANLEDTDRKYLLLKFSHDKLEILKRKDAYPYEWVDNYKKIFIQDYHQKMHFIQN